MLLLNKKNEVGLDQDEFVKAEDMKEYIAQANEKEFELAFKVNRYMALRFYLSRQALHCYL